MIVAEDDVCHEEGADVNTDNNQYGDDDRVSETKSTLDARIRHVQQVETEFDLSNNLKTEAGRGECRYLTCSTV